MIEAVEQNEHALEYRASEHKTDHESMHESVKRMAMHAYTQYKSTRRSMRS